MSCDTLVTPTLREPQTPSGLQRTAAAPTRIRQPAVSAGPYTTAPPVLALARREAKDGDMTVCLIKVVAPAGVDLLSKSIQACVLVGIGDLSREKFLVA